MVVSVFTNFLKVVVFTADPQAFLAVRNAPIFGRDQTEKNILELIHSRIGKKQGLVTDGDYG